MQWPTCGFPFLIYYRGRCPSPWRGPLQKSEKQPLILFNQYLWLAHFDLNFPRDAPSAIGCDYAPDVPGEGDISQSQRRKIWGNQLSLRFVILAYFQGKRLGCSELIINTVKETLLYYFLSTFSRNRIFFEIRKTLRYFPPCLFFLFGGSSRFSGPLDSRRSLSLRCLIKPNGPSPRSDCLINLTMPNNQPAFNCRGGSTSVSEV